MPVIQLLPRHNAAPQAQPADWPKLCQLFSQVTPTSARKDDLPAWVPASLHLPRPAPGSKYRTARYAANVEAVHFLVLDADHLSASQGQWQEILSKLTPFEYVYHSTYSHDPLVEPYTDSKDGKRKGGAAYRIILPMTHAIPGEQWRHLYQTINASFGKHNLDHKTCDPSRLYYLPYCPADRAHLAEAGYHPGQPFPSDQALRIALRDRPPDPMAEVTGQESRPWITKGDLSPIIERLEAARGPKADEKRDQADTLRQLQQGQPFAQAGGRNNAALSIVGTLMKRYPGADPESIVELFRPSLSQMDEPTVDEVRSMAERYQSPVSKEQSESDIQDAFAALGDEPRATPYTAEEIADYAARAGCSVKHFLSSRMILQTGSANYIFLAGRYMGPFLLKELQAQCAKYLAPARAAGVMVHKVTGENSLGQPTWAPKSPQELISDYGSGCLGARIELYAQESRYEPDEHLVIEAKCALRKDIQPRYDEQVERWLRGMTAGSYEYVLDWLATITDLREAAPALYISGPPSRGKGMLATSIAALWSREREATKLIKAMGKHNDDILRCPFVLGDERVPKERGIQRTDELRELIAAYSHSIERKFMPVTPARGAIRVMLAANNEEMIKQKGIDLTLDDIQAIADRLIACPIPDTAPRIDPDVAKRWATENTISSHILWLRDNHKAVRGHRFICRSYGERIARAMVVSTGLRDGVCEHIIKAVEWLAREGGYQEDLGVAVIDDQVYVNPARVAEKRDAIGAIGPRPTTATVREACHGIATGKMVRVTCVDGVRRRAKRVDLDTLREWVRIAEYDSSDFKKNLDKATALAKTRGNDMEVN